MPDFPLDGSEVRGNFRRFPPVPVRWNELDAHRHFDNARYRAIFDSVIMHRHTAVDGFDLPGGGLVPFAGGNARRSRRSPRFSDVPGAGLRRAPRWRQQCQES